MDISLYWLLFWFVEVVIWYIISISFIIISSPFFVIFFNKLSREPSIIDSFILLASICFALGLFSLHILFIKLVALHSFIHFLYLINSNGYSSEQINSNIVVDSDDLDNSEDSDNSEMQILFSFVLVLVGQID
jgi:hypothetical protein